jgi:Uma2 family endonuclease
MSAAFDSNVHPPSSMTVEEFLGWDPGDGRRWQLVDGEAVAMAPTKVTHGALQAELGAALTVHLRNAGSACFVVANPGIVPGVRSRYNFRVPDLAVACTAYSELTESMLEGAVLVVEILSPTNQHETWSAVWTYTSIPSVREILILRTLAIRAELLRRNADGTWPENPEDITEGELVLDSIGFRAPLASLYRTTRLAAR